MKTKILIVLMCLLCLASFAQSQNNTNRRRPVRRTVNRRGTRRNTNAANSNSTRTTPAPAPVTPTPDTAKKVVKAPRKYLPRPVDGYFVKNNIINAKVTPYPNLRESDVAFSKRIWRVIDVREKMNQYLASPKARLIDVLMDAIKRGELTAYNPDPNPDTSLYTKSDLDPTVDPDGDEFSKNLTADEAVQRLARMNDSVPVKLRDSLGNVIKEYKKAATISPDSVVEFEVKEDWIFDKQRSVFEPRIVGIAPMIRYVIDKKTKQLSGYFPAFWVRFLDARPILATHEVASRRSDATGLSFDDIFLKRLFTSFIIKESNANDDPIAKNFQGIDRLYEAERIKKELMDWELNLWQY